MEYTTIKSDKIGQLPFVKSYIAENDALRSIELTFDGKIYLVSSYYGLAFSEPKPDKIVDKYRVSGKIGEAEIKDRVFDSLREANNFALSVGGAVEVEIVKFNETTQEFTDDAATVKINEEGLPF